VIWSYGIATAPLGNQSCIYWFGVFVAKDLYFFAIYWSRMGINLYSIRILEKGNEEAAWSLEPQIQTLLK
jgi:hypothetical protein